MKRSLLIFLGSLLAAGQGLLMAQNISNSLPVVTVTAADATATEVTGILDTGSFVIRRSGPVTNALDITYALSGSASNGVDFGTLSYRVTMPAGTNEARVMVLPTDDAEVEPTETVVLTLQGLYVYGTNVPTVPPGANVAYYLGTPYSATVSIRDNDTATTTNHPPVVAVAYPTPTNVYYTPTNIQIYASISDAEGPTTIQRVDFFANSNLLGTVTAPAWTNTLYHWAWTNPPAGQHVLKVVATDNAGAAGQTSVVITVQAPPTSLPVVSVIAADASASEMSPMLPAFDTGSFLIRPNSALTNALEVYYTLSGSASNGVDYQFLTNHITLPAGTSGVTVVVYPIDDALVEPTETVVLTLLGLSSTNNSNPPASGYYYYRGSPYSATVSIRDNDAGTGTNYPPVVTILSPKATNVYYTPSNIVISASVTDLNGTFDLRSVEFWADSNRLAVFTIASTNSTTNAYYAYCIWSNAPAGQHTISVRAQDQQGATGAAEVGILVREIPPSLPVVSVFASDPEAAEPNPVPIGMGMPTVLNTGAFTITRTGSTLQPLTVFFSMASNLVNTTTNGTNGGIVVLTNLAVNGVDYELITSPVTIPAGATSVVVMVMPIDDTVVEQPNEVVWLTLQPSPLDSQGYVPGNQRSAMVTIMDNDTPASTVSIRATDAEAAEPNPMAMNPLAVNSGEFTVYRTGPTNDALVVYLAISGTASNGLDYATIKDTVTIPAGEVYARVAVVPLADSLREGTETVQAAIVLPQYTIMIYPPPPPPYSIVASNLAEVRILDYQPATNHPPTVNLVSPLNGARFVAPATIQVAAQAYDTVDAIRSVEFYSGATLLGVRQSSSNSGSFTLAWTNVMPGEYVLTARATDTAGSTGVSAPVTVVVTERTPQVVRTLPSGYAPGVTLRVTLQATPTSQVLAWAVEDQPPAGWMVGLISEGGAFDATFGKVKFGPFLDNRTRTLTYELTPPAEASGVYVFTGTAAFDGQSQAITGMNHLGLRLHPADANPADWRINMDELTAYAAAWRAGGSNTTVGGTPSGTGTNLNSYIPISYVTRAGLLWKGGEYYTLDPAMPTPPLCWINLPAVRAAGFDETGAPETGDGIQTCPAQSTMAANYVKGTSLNVSLSIQPKTGVSAQAVEETVPPGWTVANISDNGEYQPATRKIRWGPFLDATARTLTYQVTPGVQTAGVLTFQGVASFDGADVPIAGRRAIAPVGTPLPTTVNTVLRNENGLPVFTFIGEVGQTYILECSTDLKTWTPVNVTINNNGSFSHTDTEAPNLGQRYYRVRLSP